MRRLVVVLVIVNVALVADRILEGLWVTAEEGGGAGGVLNGDTNGDGRRDLSDAIYTLNWLFGGGPEPVACAGSPELESRVGDLEAVVFGCLTFADQNGDGFPDCGQTIPDGKPCDDGNPCTLDDAFLDQVCRGTPVPDDTPCREGEVGRCFGGACAEPECGDGVCELGENPDNCDADCECFEGETRVCGSNVGDCREGIQTCVGGRWGPCELGVEPMDEICDGRDNDCDGFTDENIARPCGSDVGDCRQGQQTCVNGRFSVCVGEVGPTDEICDGRDNDCDGMVDEDFDFETDPFNCGRCGDFCPPGTTCVSGICQ